MKYEETLKYWEDVFKDGKEYKIDEKIQLEGWEEGIEWVSSESKSILDFGCGSGKVLLRCIDKGVEYGYGIDLSKNAIKLGQKVVVSSELQNRVKLECGGMELIEKINESSLDGVILFNILDNLTPNDSKKLVKEVYRILKPDGKALIKFNPYIEKQLRDEYGFEEISHEFYRENTGLYLWNLTDDKIEELLYTYFNIEYKEKLYFKSYDMINRIYYARVKK